MPFRLRTERTSPLRALLVGLAILAGTANASAHAENYSATFTPLTELGLCEAGAEPFRIDLRAETKDANVSSEIEGVAYRRVLTTRRAGSISSRYPVDGHGASVVTDFTVQFSARLTICATPFRLDLVDGDFSIQGATQSHTMSYGSALTDEVKSLAPFWSGIGVAQPVRHGIEGDAPDAALHPLMAHRYRTVIRLPHLRVPVDFVPRSGDGSAISTELWLRFASGDFIVQPEDGG